MRTPKSDKSLSWKTAVLCYKFRRTLDFHSLNTKSILRLWQAKMSPDITKCPLRDRTAPGWEPLIQSPWHWWLARRRSSTNIRPLSSCNQGGLISFNFRDISLTHVHTDLMLHPRIGPGCLKDHADISTCVAGAHPGPLHLFHTALFPLSPLGYSSPPSHT